MKSYIQPIKGKNSTLHAVFAFFISLCICIGIFLFAEQSLIVQEKERADQIAASQAGKLQHVIENLLFTGRTAEALLEQGNGNIANFDSIMEKVLIGHPIRNIALAPSGIVTQIYPLSGNEKALGHNLLEDPSRSAESILAMETKQMTLSGPFELRQGGMGIVGRLPVFLTDENTQEEYFWGLVCVTLNIPYILMEANIASLEKHKYAYELWRIHPDTGEKQVFFQSEKALQSHPIEKAIQLPNATWTLSITPEKAWGKLDQFIYQMILSMIISILIALLSKNIIELAISRAELHSSIQQQSINYQKLTTLTDELKSFRHDVHNHMLSLSTLLEINDITQAKQYISSISDTLSATSKIINTENYIFDALLAEKLEQARNKQIVVESEVIIGKQLDIQNTDWSILFGNALDNAIEACEQVTDQTPHIHISIHYKGNILSSRISNTSPHEVLNEKGTLITTKKDVQNHGLGLKHMKTVVKKYGGVLETEYKDNIFILSFTLFHV